MNEPLHLKRERERERERERRKWKRHKDVSKEGRYLGKEWCPVSLGTMKEGWYSPNHHYVLFPLFEKWRREWMRSFIQMLTHGKSWRRAPFFLLGFAVWTRFGVCFFFAIGVGFQYVPNFLHSLKNSMIWKWKKPQHMHSTWTRNHLQNRSHFHKLQHCTTWLWNLLEKKSSKTTHKLFWPVIFFHHVYRHYSSAFWAWYVALIWPSSQSTLVFQI